MSSLFKQISQEAEKQRQQVSEGSVPSLASAVTTEPSLPAAEPAPAEPNAPFVEQEKNSTLTRKKVVPQPGATAPQSPSGEPKLDIEKLKIIIEEISQMPINSNGLNVRMSQQEMADIEDFVLITLRKQGLKGYGVSGFVALMAPTGTPREVLDRTHAAMTQIVRSASFSAKVAELGVIATPSTAEELAMRIRETSAAFATMVERAD